MDELQEALKKFSFQLYNSFGIALRDAPTMDLTSEQPPQFVEEGKKLDELVQQLVAEHAAILRCLKETETEFKDENYYEQIRQLHQDELEVNERLRQKIDEFQQYSEKLQQMNLI